MGRDGRPHGIAVTAAITAVLVVAAAAPARAASVAPATVPSAEASAATVRDIAGLFERFENPFLPENENLSECISSLPGPNCGSEARGGWRQTVVFAVVVAALVAIGARIVYGVRRRDREHGPPADQLTPSPPAHGR
jgi:hypothetical protein